MNPTIARIAQNRSTSVVWGKNIFQYEFHTPPGIGAPSYFMSVMYFEVKMNGNSQNPTAIARSDPT